MGGGRGRCPAADALRASIRHLRARQGRDAGLRDVMEVRGDSPCSWPDPDHRALPTRLHVDVGFPGHVAVEDHQTRLVIHEGTDVVTEGEPLHGIAIQATAALGGHHVTVVAERGDASDDAINAREAAGLAPDVATPVTPAHSPAGLDGNKPCTDEPAPDGDRCPAGPIGTCRVATVARWTVSLLLGDHRLADRCDQGPVHATQRGVG